MKNKKQTFTVFKLTGGRSPISWQLPIKNHLYPKGENKVPKKVHYIRTADSIFVEDYKGDEKPERIVFENGILRVSPNDKNLLDLLYGHRWYKKHYDRVDENREAERHVEQITLKKKALAKVDIADPDERRATAVALFGNRAIEWTEIRVESELNKLADTEPQRVINEMNDVDYKNKFIGAYAMLKNVIEVNPTKTAVLWSDSGGVIVRVAVGENPLHRLAEFLSQKNEQAEITLQTIGEKMKRNKRPNRTETDIINELIPEKVEENSDDASLEEATKEYIEKFKKEPPVNKKNDLDWIKSKLE